MRKTLALLVVVLSGCAGGSESTPAPQPPPTAAIEPAPIAREAVVFIGDSITDEFKPQTFPEVNAGIDGQFTSEMLDRFDADVLSQRPRVVVILGGTNDVRGGRYSVEHVATMADRAAAQGICVIVGTLPPCDLGVSRNAPEFLSWNADIQNLANAYGYKVADYYSAMVQPDGTQIPGLFYDEIHPSLAGVSVMLGVVRPLIDQCH